MFDSSTFQSYGLTAFISESEILTWVISNAAHIYASKKLQLFSLMAVLIDDKSVIGIVLYLQW